MAAPLAKRLLLSAGALVAALVAGDLLFRWLGPPLEYRTGGFARTPTGLLVPLAEYYSFTWRRGDLSEDGTGPRGRLQPGLRLRLGYEQPRWSYFDADGCIAVQNNSLGFRDEEFPVAKPKGEFRALALGDSFTYGIGVRQQDSWPEVLEDLLARERGGSVQVINCGMACGRGARSAAEYAPWVASDGLGFAPDLVVLGFCLNDFSDAVPMLGYEVPKYERVLGGICRILDYLRKYLVMRAARQRPNTIDIDGIVARDAARWQQVQTGLRQLQQTLSAAGIPFVVAVFPMLSQLDGPYPYGNLHRMVGEFCEREGIRVLDLWPAFRGRADQDLWVHPTDQHPNDVGHRIIAEQVLEYLRAQGLATAPAK
jgi:lysophospholipase L1-like esterase